MTTLCSSISPSQCVQHCQQLRPLTKAAILVAGLLCAGGAVVAHLQMLPLGCTIGFSVASAGLLTVFVAGCVGQVCLSKASGTDQIDTIKQEVARMDNQQLIAALVPMRKKELKAWLAQPHRLGEAAEKCRAEVRKAATTQKEIDVSLFKRHFILESLWMQFNDYFKTANQDVLVNILKEIFQGIPASKFETVMAIAVAAGVGQKNLTSTALILEKVVGADPARKAILEQSLVGILLTPNKYFTDNTITLKVSSQSVLAKELTLDVGSLFSDIQRTDPLPASLVEAIGSAIWDLADEIHLKVIQSDWSLAFGEPAGIALKICQKLYGSFPASKIAPLLPHLTSLPGLLGLHLEGCPSSYATSNRFTEEQHNQLHAVIRTNRSLIAFKVEHCFDEDYKSTAKLDKTMVVWAQHLEAHKDTPILDRIRPRPLEGNKK